MEVLGIAVDHPETRQRPHNGEGVGEVEEVDSGAQDGRVGHRPSHLETVADLELGISVRLHNDIGDVGVVGLVRVDIGRADDLQEVQNCVVGSVLEGVRVVKQ